MGWGSRVYNLGGIAGITQVGGLALGLSILGRKFGWFGGNAQNFLNGMFSEGFNVPLVENIVRAGPNTANGGQSANMLPGTNGGIQSAIMKHLNNPGSSLVSGTPAGIPMSPSFVPDFAYS